MIDVISIIEDFKNYTFDRRCELIFSIDDEYYELIELRDKIQDVNKMPDYIKNDWYKYNGIPLTEKTLDKHLADAEENIKRPRSVINNIDLEMDKLKELRSLKRNFKIDSIL